MLASSRARLLGSANGWNAAPAAPQMPAAPLKAAMKVVQRHQGPSAAVGVPSLGQSMRYRFLPQMARLRLLNCAAGWGYPPLTATS